MNKQDLINKITELKESKKKSKGLDEAIIVLEQSLSLLESLEKKIEDQKIESSGKDKEILELNQVIKNQSEELERLYSDMR